MNTNRLCRKCQSPIPSRITIDGKSHVLINRKFCLDCSPFKKHNTSKYDPTERRKQGSYSNWHEKSKDTIKKTLYKKAYIRKLNLIKEKGGHCQICGYNKSIRVLSFHHRNPEEKLFGLSLNNLWSKSLEAIQLESEKCDLVCLNCHAEIEEKIANQNLGPLLKQVKTELNLI